MVADFPVVRYKKHIFGVLWNSQWVKIFLSKLFFIKWFENSKQENWYCIFNLTNWVFHGSASLHYHSNVIQLNQKPSKMLCNFIKILENQWNFQIDLLSVTFSLIFSAKSIFLKMTLLVTLLPSKILILSIFYIYI